MGKTTIEFPFSTDGINNAIAQIHAYEQRLELATKRLVSELGKRGIHIAQMSNVGDFAQYIVFGKRVYVSSKEIYIEVLYGKNTQLVTVEWDMTKNGQIVGKHTAEVNPILMTEFGSGFLADNPSGFNKVPVGQGTFPNQKHAFQPTGWRWYEDGVMHESNGSPAYAPMHNAFIGMHMEIMNVAREVFK